MDTAPIFQPAKSKYIVLTLDYLIPFMITCGVLLLVYLTMFSKLFTISTVVCNLDFEPCQNQSLLAELDKLNAQNIFTLQLAPIKARLISGDFMLREVSVKRTLPGTISFALESIYPVVALSIEGDPQWVVLDDRYRVIAVKAQDPNVPTVIVPGPLQVVVGQPLTDQTIIQTLDLVRRLTQELISVKTITLKDTTQIELKLNSGIKAILTPQKDELAQLRLLQAILADDTITKGITTIDVRFKSPVLR